MKNRKVMVLILILVTLLSVVSVEASQTRFISAMPSLSFNGRTVNCFGDCSADTMNDEVSIYLYLYEDGVYKTQWHASGNGYATVDETYSPAISGTPYTLTLGYVVNGTVGRPVSVTKTCP